MPAALDRQILPFLNGNHGRSETANLAAHSIEEYAFKNTHMNNTQYAKCISIKTQSKLTPLALRCFHTGTGWVLLICTLSFMRLPNSSL